MEIGQKRFHQAKTSVGCIRPTPSGVDEDVGLSSLGLNGSVFGSGELQRTDRRCPNGDNPPSLCTGSVQLRRGFFSDLIRLGVKFVLLDNLTSHGLKRTQPYMQSQFRDFDAPGPNFLQNLGREVQARRGRRYRPRRLGEDGLILLSVPLLVGAVNIRRQRHVSDMLDSLQKIRHGQEPNCAFPQVPVSYYFRLKSIGGAFTKTDRLSRPDFSSGPHQALPDRRLRLQLLGQQDLHATVKKLFHRRIARAKWLRMQARAMSKKAGWDNTSVIQDQEVSGTEKLREISKMIVAEPSGSAIHVKHASRRTVRKRLLRNEFFWEMEIEIRDEHSRIIVLTERLLPCAGFGWRRPDGCGTIRTLPDFPSFFRAAVLSMSAYEVRQEIVRVGKSLYDKGFIAASDGNISVRLDERRLLATPTCMCKGMMSAEDMVVIDMQGRRLEGFRDVSSEIGMHLMIYSVRPDVNAIVHAHPVTATGFASAGIPLDKPLVSEVVLALGSVPLAEYATPGTRALVNSLAPLVPDHNAILMANHGVVAYAEDLVTAYMNMETVEHFAKIALTTHLLGKERPLNERQVEELMEIRKKLHAGKLAMLRRE